MGVQPPKLWGLWEGRAPRFGDEYPQFGAQHPLLAWRVTQSPGACPKGFLQIQRFLFLEQGAWDLWQRGEQSDSLQVGGGWGGSWDDGSVPARSRGVPGRASSAPHQ